MTVITRFVMFIAILSLFATGCSRSGVSSDDVATTSTSTGTGVITIVETLSQQVDVILWVHLQNDGEATITDLTVTVEPLSAIGTVLGTWTIDLPDRELSSGEEIAFDISFSPTLTSHANYENIQYSFTWTESNEGILYTQDL